MIQSVGVGIVGAGAIVQTGYNPAFKRVGIQPFAVRKNPNERPPLQKLFQGSNQSDIIIVASPPSAHRPNLCTLAEYIKFIHGLTGINEYNPSIFCEKPLCTRIEDIERIKNLRKIHNIYAIDHWTVRSPLFYLALKGKEYVQEHFPNYGKIYLNSIQESGSLESIKDCNLSDIESIEGFLLEKSTADTQTGEPLALNFATGQPDPRTFRYPDGVILDTATHPLALIREILTGMGSEESKLEIKIEDMRDKYGKPIQSNDWSTAEGSAKLTLSISGIPIRIDVNKYAGEQNRKGIIINFKDGSSLSLSRINNEDILELRDQQAKQLGKMEIQSPLYDILVRHSIRPPSPRSSSLGNYKGLTSRRIEEISTLLQAINLERTGIQ